MAFTLHCPVCNATTAIVTDAKDVPERDGLGHKDSHCSVHHPDPARRHPSELPVRMKVAIAKEGE